MILQVIRAIISLLVVIGFVFFILKSRFFSNLHKNPNKTHRINIHERLKISSKVELLLISVDNQKILLGVSADKLSLISGVVPTDQTSENANINKEIEFKRSII
ncbi:flagellar biosynthetic protein FliO [bacterium]|nr:flagellar biosynthetic protein FliO [bacterium]